MLKKIAIVGTVGLPAKYGGFETLAEYLVKYLAKKYSLTVYCSSKSYEHRAKYYNQAKLVYIPLNANGVQSIPYDMISIVKSLRYADTLLILGVSGCIILPIIKLISRKRIVVNIDGLEWRRGKWNKYAKWFLKYSEKLAVNYADVVITDNKVIQDYVKTEHKKDSVLIAYGADHVEKLKLSQQVVDTFSFLQQRYAFTVCRIEPENNLHIILQAMAKQSDLQLLIIGNWDASQYGIDLRANETSIDVLEDYINEGNSVILHMAGEVGHYVVATEIKDGMVEYVDYDGKTYAASQDKFIKDGNVNILSHRTFLR